MKKYFYGLAEISAQTAREEGLSRIDPKWIYVQWCHETADFTSELCQVYKNLGGLTQLEPNDTPQPDGDYYYMHFSTYEECAQYFGSYLINFVDGGIREASTLAEYITALKNSPSGAYFVDSLQNYLAACQAIFVQTFET